MEVAFVFSRLRTYREEEILDIIREQIRRSSGKATWEVGETDDRHAVGGGDYGVGDAVEDEARARSEATS